METEQSHMGSATTNFIWKIIKALLFVLLSVLVPVHNPNWNARCLSFGGFCTRCNKQHVLPTTDDAKRAALDLRRRIVQSGRIDIDELPVEQQARLLGDASASIQNATAVATNTVHENQSAECTLLESLNPSLSTERLFERRGKMFGVLVCEAPRNSSTTVLENGPNALSTINQRGDVVILKAYAGKLGGEWNLPGWAPLVGKVPESIPEFREKSAQVTNLFEEIEKLSLANDDNVAEQIKELTKERSRLSTLCIDDLRKHQVLTNFRGIRMPIQETFAKGPDKLPGGTGDCAAPKLVALAVKLGLKPTGICEIFIGATGGMSTTKGDGEFYDACEPRCQQIAGYMLCGLSDDD